jgi:hypothetical protein
MADDNFKKMLFGIVLTTLFSVLVIGAAISFGNSYGRDTSEIVGSLNYHALNSSISDVQSTSENLRRSFERQSIWSAVAGIVVTGIFIIAKSMVLMIIFPFSLILGIMINVLHIPIIVSGVITGLLLLSIIFGIWKLLKLGE